MSATSFSGRDAFAANAAAEPMTTSTPASARLVRIGGGRDAGAGRRPYPHHHVAAGCVREHRWVRDHNGCAADRALVRLLGDVVAEDLTIRCPEHAQPAADGPGDHDCDGLRR